MSIVNPKRAYRPGSGTSALGARERWRRAFYNLVQLWERPLLAGLLALLIYALIATYYHPSWQATPVAYYNYLADALLHGSLSLRQLPPSTHDLSFYQGRYYLYWSPLPAVLLMPFVALFGVGFSDIAFTVVVAALNVGLVALLLRAATAARIIRLDRLRRGILVICFAFGSVHLTLAPLGRVWHTGQLIGFLCTLLAYLLAIRGRGLPAFALTGLAIAAALLTRNHLVFAGIWPAVYLLYRHRAAGWRYQALGALAGLAPAIAAVGLLALYNYLRFGGWLDNGLDYHEMADIFVDNYRQYGAFHPFYLPTNFYYQYLAYPLPVRADTGYGGSLFLLTPIFFGCFVGAARLRPRWSMWLLVVSILGVATPILLLMGTGWVQFGPRYTLDFSVPLLLLTAHGIRRWPRHILVLLTILAIVHYSIGLSLIGSMG